jgi:hypothetical protein
MVHPGRKRVKTRLFDRRCDGIAQRPAKPRCRTPRAAILEPCAGSLPVRGKHRREHPRAEHAVRNSRWRCAAHGLDVEHLVADGIPSRILIRVGPENRAARSGSLCGPEFAVSGPSPRADEQDHGDGEHGERFPQPVVPGHRGRIIAARRPSSRACRVEHFASLLGPRWPTGRPPPGARGRSKLWHGPRSRPSPAASATRRPGRSATQAESADTCRRTAR